MSAYIVDAQTMNRVLSGFPDLAGPDPTATGRRLFGLNAEAIRYRYPDTIDKPEDMPGPANAHLLPTEYVFTKVDVDPVQALKSLHCLIYQCTEGVVPARPLYHELEQAEAAADPGHTIEHSDAYDEAEWG